MNRFSICAALILGFLSVQPALTQAQDIEVDAGRGPISVNVPPSYDASEPMPLVLLLHGYGSSGLIQEAYMAFTPLSDSRGFLYAAPDGLTDPGGSQYWNGTDACCDFYSDTDDSGYLRGLIESIQGELSVDDRRIYLIGHSNGGYMSYRMACDHADLIAAIAPLAGVTWLDPAQCNPSEPVSVLHMHGTSDATVLYDGGCFSEDGLCYPGAVDTLNMWADFNGCQGGSVRSGNFNYDRLRPGPETSARTNLDGCPDGGALEFWKLKGSGHVPLFTDPWNDAVIDFLLANPKP